MIGKEQQIYRKKRCVCCFFISSCLVSSDKTSAWKNTVNSFFIPRIKKKKNPGNLIFKFWLLEVISQVCDDVQLLHCGTIAESEFLLSPVHRRCNAICFHGDASYIWNLNELGSWSACSDLALWSHNRVLLSTLRWPGCYWNRFLSPWQAVAESRRWNVTGKIKEHNYSLDSSLEMKYPCPVLDFSLLLLLTCVFKVGLCRVPIFAGTRPLSSIPGFFLPMNTFRYFV